MRQSIMQISMSKCLNARLYAIMPILSLPSKLLSFRDILIRVVNSFVLALSTNFRAEFKQNPGNGQQDQRHKAKETASPIDSKLVVH